MYSHRAAVCSVALCALGVLAIVGLAHSQVTPRLNLPANQTSAVKRDPILPREQFMGPNLVAHIRILSPLDNSMTLTMENPRGASGSLYGGDAYTFGFGSNRLTFWLKDGFVGGSFLPVKTGARYVADYSIEVSGAFEGHGQGATTFIIFGQKPGGWEKMETKVPNGSHHLTTYVAGSGTEIITTQILALDDRRSWEFKSLTITRVQ